MAKSNPFQGLRLRSGFIIVCLQFVTEPMVDAIGRPALATTRINDREFRLTIFSSLTDKEKSITLYHEILEAMTVASSQAPASVRDFNEGDFERAATMPTSDSGPPHPKAWTGCCNFTVFGKNKVMGHRNKIQVDLIKLTSGERLLRLSYLPLELVLEKKLDPTQTVVGQKERLFAVFEAALSQAELTPA
jgi:hypothetical protein